MAKATDAQIKNVKDAMKSGGNLPSGVRINFGDPEPYQKNGANTRTVQKPNDTKDDK